VRPTMIERAETPDQGADAARLCSLVFLNGKILDQFAMTVKDAINQARLPPVRFGEAIEWALVSGWIRRRATHIELTAAGLYVAKAYLDLPR
jgi:hypothetical protein